MEGPHRRHDPLRDAWVLVSAGRDARPWKGRVEPAPAPAAPSYDPACQLCPRNLRAGGQRNPDYEATFVFTNDFPALRPETPHRREADGLHVAEAESGTARVLCFSPRHDVSLGGLPRAAVRAVVDHWASQSAELGARYRWVQVFENRGEAMGASNPHPHGQIWAGTALPVEAEREDRTQRDHWARTGRQLLGDVAAEERGGPRAVEDAGGWLAIVPFWAAWPFETLIIAPAGIARLADLDDGARDALATLIGRLLRRYDALFGRPFPYSMGWHQAPYEPGAATSSASGGVSADAPHWRLHGHVYPPLLRADARKFMVGYELLAEPQRDLTPEDAAERLRRATSRR
jgi:UDPglucose--hexose-1-phosphate uridylyltransferase